MRTSLPEEIAHALDRQALVVTANQRSARALQIAYEQWQIQGGRNVWQPSRILSWEVWTHELWKQLLVQGHEIRLLLTPAQEALIWQEILASDKHLQTLRDRSALAPLAQRAWALLASYLGLHQLSSLGVSIDTEHFQRWATEFGRRCSREKWLSAAQLEQALAQAVSTKSLHPDATEILLVGFDRMAPAQQQLCESLRKIGTECTSLTLPPPPMPATVSREVNSETLVAAMTADDEIYAVACWAKSFLQQLPDARIAIILPDVNAQRYRIDRIFRKTFLSTSHLPEAAGALPYEFTLGTSLSNVPTVSTALRFLQWLTKPQPLETVSGLVLSPYFGNSALDLSDRALFDADPLRQNQLLRPEISLPWLLKNMAGKMALIHLHEQWSAAYSLAQQHCGEGQFRTFREWAMLIQRILSTAGWVASLPLSSGEYQQKEKWNEQLRSLAKLDFTDKKVAFSAALEKLEHATRETLFAPESHNPPIQIMGVLESSGSVYDAIWFAGVTAESWPMRGNLQPLLPWHVQRSLKMPHSDPAVDTEHAKEVMRRISTSTSYILFSYCKRLDEVETEPSALIAPFLSTTSVSATDLIAKAEPQASCFPLEEFDPEGAIPHASNQLLAGGTGLLKLQSLCPFRAFAEKRLASTGLQSAEIGWNAITRGNMIHQVLDGFWKTVRTQQDLLDLDSNAVTEILRKEISHSFAQWTRTTDPWEQAYLSIQKKWLQQLLLQWLEVEKERPAFAVIESEETQKNAQIGPLHLAIRPDRIDTVADGEVILDYKTGVCSLASWKGDRPDEPQLLLYATQRNPDTLRGIAFAQIRAGDMKLLGRFENLVDQTQEWRAVLENLAKEFYQGIATVTPKDFPKTCEYCEQKFFCRVAEINSTSTENLSNGNSD